MNSRTSHLQAPGRMAGFTLIEIMISVAIVAIITAIALPSYRSNVARSKRAEAASIIMEAAQYMQRYYSANDGYTNSLPAVLQNVPRGATSGQTYTLSVVTNTNSTTYTITAAISSTGSQAGDSCGNYVLNAQGQKLNAVNGAAAAVVSDCWK